jgi:hypothetical protein
MDIERSFLAKVVETGRFDAPMARGIDETHFADADLGTVWRWCADHIRRYRSTPSEEAIRNQFPNFLFEATTDSFEWLLDEFLQLVRRRKAETLLEQLAVDMSTGDKPDFEGLMYNAANELAQQLPGGDVASFADMNTRIDTYVAR